MQSISLLLKVLWSPGEAMFLLAKNPRVLVPILFLVFSALASSIAVGTKAKYGEMYMNMITHSPQGARMPPEQRANMEKVMSLPAIQGALIGASIVFTVVIVVVIALIYFALFTIVGREGGFKAFLSITAYAFVPMIFSHMAAVARAFVMPTATLMFDELASISPSAFLERDTVSPLLFATSTSVDLVSLWTLILLVIGYGFTASKTVSKTTRVLVTLAPFMLYQVLKLGAVALAS